MPLAAGSAMAAAQDEVGGARVMSGDDPDAQSVIMRSRAGSWKDATLLLALGLLVGLALLQSPGTGDRAQWLVYMDTARDNGLLAIYQIAAVTGVGMGPTDYPPLALVVLALFAKLAKAVGMSDFISLKLSILLFLLACAGVMAIWRGWVFGIALYLVLAIDALLLSYLDVYFVVSFLLALWCMEQNKYAAGAALFTVSFLTKWQPIILAPLILLYVLPRPFRTADLVRLVPAAIVLCVVYLIFGNAMITAFTRGAADPTFSGKALNFDWLVTALSEVGQLEARAGVVRSITLGELPDGIYRTLAQASSVLRYVCYLITVLDFALSSRSTTDLVRAAILCFLAYFMFGGGVHENHACLAAVLGLCWMATDRSRYIEATILAAMFNINIVVFYGFSGSGLQFSYVLGGVDITVLLALLNLIVFLILWLPVATRVLSQLPKLGFSGTAAGGTARAAPLHRNADS
jgi:hypothetical protein